MKRYVQISPKVTELENCPPSYFLHFIKDKPLKVISATQDDVTVKDENEEQWSIAKGGFEDLKPSEILL